MASSGLWSSRVPRTPSFQCNKESNQGFCATHPVVHRQPWSSAVISSLQTCVQPGHHSCRDQQSRSLLATAHHGNSSTRLASCGSAASSKLGSSRASHSNCSTRPAETDRSANTSQPLAAAGLNGNGNSKRQHSSSEGSSCRSHSDRNLQQASGAVIMRQLKAATGWQQLQELVQQHGQRFNQRHSSALITHLAQITAVQQQVSQPSDFTSLKDNCGQQPEQPGLEFEPLIDLQQLAAAASLASAGLKPFSIDASSSGSSLEPGAQSFLRHTVAPLMDAHMQQFDARGLANVIWALAHLQPLLQPGGEPYPSRRWLGSFCKISQPLLHNCDAQQLSNMLWALVQLQHPPPDSWLKEWYAAFAAQAEFGIGLPVARQSNRGHSVQLQSLSTALWSLAQLQQSSTCSAAPQGWVQSLLQLAAARLQSSGTSGTGQAISNVLWSCVQLQEQPPAEVLQVLQQHTQAAVAGNAAQRRHLLSDQSLSNIMWSLGKLWSQQHNSNSLQAYASESLDVQDRQYSQQDAGCIIDSSCSSSHSSRDPAKAAHEILHDCRDAGSHVDSRASSGQFNVALRHCCSLLFTASTSRLPNIGWRHLASIIYAAGMLQLRPSKEWIQQLEERLQQPAVAAMGDQELSNLLWGLSHLQLFKQQKQQQQQSNRQPDTFLQQQQQGQVNWGTAWSLPFEQHVLQHVLELQQRRLPGYSSLALHSSLLSLGRLGFRPPDALLQAWLKELARRNYLVGAGGQAMAEACCALALLRRNQAAAGSRSSSYSSSSRTSRWGRDTSISSSRGRFQQVEDSEYLTEFCAASASRLSACTADQLAGIGWALAALGFRPPLPWVVSWLSAVVAVAPNMSGAAAARALWALNKLSSGASGAVKASAAAKLVSAAVAAAAAGRSDAHSIAAAADCIADLHCSGFSTCRDVDLATADGSSSSWVDAQIAVEQLLLALPQSLQGVTSHELLLILSAAAAVGAALPSWLLALLTERCHYYIRRQQLSNRVISGMLVAVAQSRATAAAAASKAARAQPQQHNPAGGEVIHKWVVCMLRQFNAETATPTELAMVMWSLAALDHTPGHNWIKQQWMKYSQALIPRFTASQLASVGWALTVLNHKPTPSWSKAWVHAAAVQAAAATPTELALLLYSAATLGCQVEKSWLMSTAVLAANSIQRWSLRDLSYGLWGLAQLGLRAVADGELLDVLFSRLTAQSAAVEMQGLSQFHLLQLLQAAVLLRPPAAAGSAAAAVLGSEEWWFSKPPRQPVSKTTIRKMRWRAKTATRQAHAAAAAAVAANQRHQQLLSLQPSMTDSSDEALVPAAAAAREAAVMYRTQAVAAVYASAALTTATTRRSPDAVGVPVDPSWVLMWCQAAAQHVTHWSPSTAAAALSGLAALGVPPPVMWQQHVLQAVLQKRKHIRGREISNISRALELLQSPFRQQWLSQVAVSYSPARSAAAAGAQEPSEDHAVQQQSSRQQRRREWCRRWLQHMRQQKRSVQEFVGSSRQVQYGQYADALKGVKYPQLLDQQSLLRMRRQHSSTRLLSWWQRQQQFLHHQRRQRVLQQQWRAAAAAQAARSVWGTSSRRKWRGPSISSDDAANTDAQYSGYSDWSSSAASSMDITTPLSFSSSSSDGGLPGGVSLGARVLSLTDKQGGLKLAQKPVLSASAPPATPLVNNGTASVSSNTASDVNSRGGHVSRSAPADSAANPGLDGNAQAIDAVGNSSSSQQGVAAEGAAAISNGTGTASVAVSADAAAAQAVVYSLNGSAYSLRDSPLGGGRASASVDLNSVHVVDVHGPAGDRLQQQYLSWACQIN